jgi:hypothetical protein
MNIPYNLPPTIRLSEHLYRSDLVEIEVPKHRHPHLFQTICEVYRCPHLLIAKIGRFRCMWPAKNS